jgi:hypothetical protein
MPTVLLNDLLCEEIILMCLPSWGDQYIILKNWGKVSHVWVVVGVLYSTTCVSYTPTTTKHAAAPLAMAQQPRHDELVLVAFLTNTCQYTKGCDPLANA